MIKLKTFGSFTVGNDITSVQEGAWRSEKLEKLFVYLAMNRNRGVCIAVSYTHLTLPTN